MLSGVLSGVLCGVRGQCAARWLGGLLAGMGLALVVVFSALAGQSGSVEEVVLFRAGWGLGIALFISTSMSALISHTNGGPQRAVVLFESALGVGIASGPLLGAVLGAQSWRAPFFGVALLMGVAFLILVGWTFLRPVAAGHRRAALSIFEREDEIDG